MKARDLMTDNLELGRNPITIELIKVMAIIPV
jgi:hypothetical protein